MAADPDDPYVPETWLTPPRVIVPAVEVPPLLSNPFAVPLMDKFPLTAVAFEIVLFPDPLNERFPL